MQHTNMTGTAVERRDETTQLAPDHAPDYAPPRRRRRWWPYLLLAVLLLAGAAAAAGVLVVTRDEPGTAPKAANYPAWWDPRVQPYVEAVEAQRKLKFKHPVYVDFLTVRTFTKRMSVDREELTDKELEEAEQASGLFRALGLVEGHFDLVEVMNQSYGSGTLGTYSYEDQRIRVRGTELTPAVQATLVHELTHALQDQHFDLSGHYKKFEKDKDSHAASGAYDAVVEGDAERIEEAWTEDLTKAQKKALDASQNKQSKAIEKKIAKVPDVVWTMLLTSYTFGDALMWAAQQEDGSGGIDALFEDPPTNEEHLLDPWTFLSDADDAENVEAPKVPGDRKPLDDGDFGALGWLIMLGERIPHEKALTAVDGWGGDAYVAYREDDRTCVRAHYKGETPRDFEEMKAALSQWVARMPGASASVRAEGDMLIFSSCDPGTDAKSAETGNSQGAVDLAVGRTYLTGTLVDAGWPTPDARCAADRIVREFTAEEINNPDTPPDPKRLRRTLAPCR